MTCGTYRWPSPAPKRKLATWAWVLLSIGGVLVLSCAGCLGFLWHVSSSGPETKVYLGHELPAKYADTMRNLGVLEAGEQVQYFYSDALTDIRDGFSVLTDKKIAIYNKDAAQPTTVVKYDRIRDASMDKGSGLDDSTINLKLVDDTAVSFPVSTDLNRDTMVLDAIKKRMKPDAELGRASSR